MDSKRTDNYNKLNYWLNKEIPQNYLIRKHFKGSLIVVLFCFSFLMLFKPLNPNENKIFGYEAAMAMYSFLLGLVHLALTALLKSIKYFSNEKAWTLRKELIYIFLVLPAFGLTVYLSGFIIENDGPVLWVAFRDAALIGMVPLVFFSLINIKSLYHEYDVDLENRAEDHEPAINIKSQLKGEELNIIPGELVYVEANGNYVDFYLNKAGLTEKMTIRNSVSAIEEQFEDHPYIIRTHRAFIVNLKNVSSQKGNSLGYRLGVMGFEKKIPVSRNKIRVYDQQFAKYRSS